MKQYSVQEAAMALGVDIQTLSSWLSHDGGNLAHIDPHNPQQYVLNQAQVEQLAREHNQSLLVPQAHNNGGMQAGTPSTLHPTISNQVPQNKQPVAPVTLQGNGKGSTENLSTAVPPPVHNQIAPANVPDLKPIPLEAPLITIGRAGNNTIVLNHPQVSNYHARLEREPGGGYRIIDLDSTNHVYVNSLLVRAKDLNPGDTIRIGPFAFTYTGNQLIQQDNSFSIRVDALHLKSTGKRFTTLLNDISIDIPPRTLVALVGSSGVGKTTLLNALSGLRPAQKGEVLYNGQDYYENLAVYSNQLGYVPQDDIVHRDLSVQQALYYTARMRLPGDFTRSQIKERVNAVLDEVEMRPRRRHLVRSLSGGERKRVSIALELLANPSIFFLDEPTAGLDPGLERKMVQLLRKLADKGHTIVLVTHATRNVHFCDYVCYIARGGRLAFYGPPAEAQAYFGTNDYAEIYNSLEPTDNNKNIPKQAEEKFKRSPYYERFVREPLNRELEEYEKAPPLPPVIKLAKRGRPFKQFSLLSRRYLHLLLNDAGNLLILLLQAPIIGLILFYLAGAATFNSTSVTTCPIRSNPVTNTGQIVSYDCQHVVDLLKTPQGQMYAQQHGHTPQQLLESVIMPNSGADAQTLLFIMAFAGVMFGCLNGVRSIVREAPIYRRERMVNLGIIPYMFSKIVVLGVFCFMQSAILVYLVNLKAPFHQGIFLPVVAEVYITIALTTFSGLMLGLAISAIAPNSDRAMSFIPLVLLPQVIFSGIIFNLNTPILQALGAFFAARWAMAGLGSSLGLHGDKLGVDNFSYQSTHFVSLDPASALPAAIMHLLLAWGALLAIIIALGFVIAIFLKRKDVHM
jgi:ABC-type multidrug transport system ATPase subunit